VTEWIDLPPPAVSDGGSLADALPRAATVSAAHPGEGRAERIAQGPETATGR